LKKKLLAERHKEQQATAAAATMGDPALKSATTAQQAAAAAYGSSGVTVPNVPCVPSRPCPQMQQGNMQLQLTPEQQQAQMIAAKERERVDNSRFASNLVFARPSEQAQQPGQMTPTQLGPADRQANSSLVAPEAERKPEDAPGSTTTTFRSSAPRSLWVWSPEPVRSRREAGPLPRVVPRHLRPARQPAFRSPAQRSSTASYRFRQPSRFGKATG
jgi:hypothetical protein